MFVRRSQLGLRQFAGGQDELIFDGNSFVLNADGHCVAKLAHCQQTAANREFDGARALPESAAELSEAQCIKPWSGVRDYVTKNDSLVS